MSAPRAVKIRYAKNIPVTQEYTNLGQVYLPESLIMVSLAILPPSRNPPMG